MGCQHTKLNAGEKMPENCAMDCDEPNQVISNHRMEDLEPVVVSPRQKEIILDIWKLLVENISNVGVITFMNAWTDIP
ncbi:hypothetical protein CDAR_294271 [Caerostris darwini]|uniref:Uncharacterized protein n=1 Tax=Caerostris darwini TaxID=1538125 RepID=A0AAV4R168_9ARAC|nr:hypothetical protein CDAR_294271 [Caerostris darwini]